jgi:hypothetical protein
MIMYIGALLKTPLLSLRSEHLVELDVRYVLCSLLATGPRRRDTTIPGWGMVTAVPMPLVSLAGDPLLSSR